MARQTRTGLFSMKESSRSLILDIVHRHGPLSRAQLARQTQLDPSTVTRIITEMMDRGFVREVGHGLSDGGRKPILIDLVPDVVFIIGIDVEATSVAGILADLKGHIVSRVEHVIRSVAKEDILGLVKKSIDALLIEAEKAHVHVAGVGLAMHGLVSNGVALFPPAFGWRELPIAQLLEDTYGLPVRVENNARAMALGERRFGAGINESNFICLKIGRGIGSGIIIGGQIFRGLDQSAGEIGHTTVSVDGPLCDCGNYGCLESIASTRALVRQARRLLKEGVQSRILGLVEGEIDQVSASHVYQAAREGDALALRLLDEMGRYLGIAIANLVNILNPNMVLLGGDILEALDLLLPTIGKIATARAMKLPVQRLRIEPVKLGVDSVLIGAITLILEKGTSWPSG